MISCENNNLRHVVKMSAAQFFDHLVAVFTRHGQIDDDQVRNAILDGAQALHAVGRFRNLISFGFETGTQGQSNSTFIINDQYPGLVARRPRLGLRRPLRRDQLHSTTPASHLQVLRLLQAGPDAQARQHQPSEA